MGIPDELNGLLNEATDWEYAWDLDPDESRQRIVAEAEELLAVMTLGTLDKQPDPDHVMTSDDEEIVPCTEG